MPDGRTSSGLGQADVAKVDAGIERTGILARLTGGNATYKVFSAALIVAIFTAVAKVATVAKDLLLARAFGTDSRMDAFLMAFAIPFFVMSVVSSSLNAAFVPTFIRVRQQEGHEASQKLFSTVLFWTVLVLGFLTVLLGLFASPILQAIASGFDAQKLELTRALFLILLPGVIIYGAASLWSGVLNAEHRFGIPAVIPVITPLFIGLTVLGDSTRSVKALAISTVIGLTVESILLGIALTREGIALKIRAGQVTHAVKQVLVQYLPMACGSLILSSTFLVNQSMAASLGSGSVAALSYGSKIVTSVLNVSGLALGTAVLPHLSRLAAARDTAGLRHTLRTFGAWVAVGSTMVTIVLCVFSVPLTRLVFQRGNFTAADTQLVSNVQTCFALQIPFYLGGTLLVRYFASANATRVMMWGAVLSFGANVSFNYLLMRPLGVVGISLSTSIVYFLSFAFLLFMLKRIRMEAA